jgi:hypothetical protein
MDAALSPTEDDQCTSDQLSMANRHLPFLASATEWLIRWAKARRVFSDKDIGFLTRNMLVTMVKVCVDNTLRTRVNNCGAFVKHFFSTFARWRFNECSIAGDCCSPAGDNTTGTLNGSLIDEYEGIDSDIEGANSGQRVEAFASSERSDTDPNRHLPAVADDNDEVHPHKRRRYELGQIRDIRRFYDVENTYPLRIAVPDDQEYPISLDRLDALSIVDPSDPHVNIAIRVLESHKKMIVQELVRADMLLCDLKISEEWDVLKHGTHVIKLAELPECTCYIVFTIHSEDSDVRSEVAQIVEEQTWFLIQEVQAFHGVMVTPFNEMIKSDSTSLQVVVGIDFVSDEPYSAQDGVHLDFSGPMSRVLLRARKTVQSREDFESRFSKRLSVSTALVPRKNFRG